MRLKMIAVAVSVMCLMGGSASAADVTGTWVAEMAPPQSGPGGSPSGGPGGGPGGGGPMKFTFNLKAKGSSLSGTMIGPMGNENEIIDGKIDNDNVSFAVKVNRMGNEMKINYKRFFINGCFVSPRTCPAHRCSIRNSSRRGIGGIRPLYGGSGHFQS